MKCAQFEQWSCCSILCFGTAFTSDVTAQLNSRKRGGAPDTKKPDPYYSLIVWCHLRMIPFTSFCQCKLWLNIQIWIHELGRFRLWINQLLTIYQSVHITSFPLNETRNQTEQVSFNLFPFFSQNKVWNNFC